MELTFGVTLAVLGAGLLHAGWNALLKSAAGGDALLDTAMISAGSTVCSLVVLPFVALPDRSAWLLLATSMVIHFAYYLTLAQAYRTGDLSFAYPLMRGTAPPAPWRTHHPATPGCAWNPRTEIHDIPAVLRTNSAWPRRAAQWAPARSPGIARAGTAAR